jgi:hypothetical protein
MRRHTGPAQASARQSSGQCAVAGRSRGSFALPAARRSALPCHCRSFQSLVRPLVVQQRSQFAPKLLLESP